jgi:hypothetical protein
MVKTGIFKRHDVLCEVSLTSDNEFPEGLLRRCIVINEIYTEIDAMNESPYTFFACAY